MVMTAISYEEAFADVRARVAKSRSSFHAGMAVLPRNRREAMYALYAFCREVDDIADDSPSPEIAAKGLESWRQRVKDLFLGRASETITTALLPAVKTFHLIEEDFHSVIDGMAMDARVICAPDEKTFDLYCDRVASAVGRISVRIFGDASAKAQEVAYHLGRALQTTNILRDLAEDSTRGRLYLPVELLEKYGVTSRQPAEVIRDTRLPVLCRDLAQQAQKHFVAADEAMKDCLPSAMRPARVMRAYYGAILQRLVKLDWQDPFTRLRLPAWQKLFLVLRYGVF